MALPVQEQKALGHVVGEGGKLGLPLLEQVHLLLDGVVLPLQAGEEGGELVVGLTVLRVLQIQAQNRLDQPLGQPGGQHRREQQRQNQDDQNGLDHGDEQQPHRLLGAGQTDHRPVGEPLGDIQGLLRQSGGEALGGARLRGQGLPDLLPVGVVLHGGGVRLIVVEDCAVGGHPGHPAGGVQAVEVIHAVQLHPAGHQPGLRAVPAERSVLIL